MTNPGLLSYGKFWDGLASARLYNEIQGVGFVFPKSKQPPFTYYIYIDKKNFTIESPDLEKYKEN